MNEINYQADTLNPADLLKRLEYLENQLAENEDEFFDYDELKELHGNEDTLKQLAENGAILINSDYFKDYIQNDLKENGMLDGVPNFLVIDWESTANDMLGDFSEIDLNGEYFYY
ncbi:MAG: hypothetical protein KDC67_05180 [Ignavibacteriae bacterium]|nr:hypothetical protein [Ignavibacteriota bacterium]